MEAFGIDLITAVLALAGMLTHQLKQIVQAQRDGGDAFKIVAYWTANWAQSLLALVSSAALVALQVYTGEATPVGAYLAGIAGNSAAELIGSRTVGGAKV